MFDHNIFQDNLVGVDFCEQMVKETNPKVLAKAERPHCVRTPNCTAIRTIADIMRALNPFTGAFYREALQMSRLTREMFCLMEGRHVHPSTLYPGGVGTVPSVQLFTDYITRLMKYVEFMKKVVPLHDDLFDFFYEALPGYEKVGQRRILLRLLGIVPGSQVLRLHLQEHDRVGPRDVRHAGRGGGRQTGHHRPGGHQSAASGSCWAVPITMTGRRRDVRQNKIRWAIPSISGIPGTRPQRRVRRSATSRANTRG